MNEIAKTKANEMYELCPEDVKDETGAAYLWAKNILMHKEGSGHNLTLTATKDGLVVCSLCKPEWKADHTGEGMDTGAEAIVMATCEYLMGA